MKKIIIILIIIFVLMDFYALICANNQIQPTIAVISFEDNSNDSISGLDEIGLLLLESSLSQINEFSLIDRDTIHKKIEEIHIKGTQESKETEFYYRLSKTLGARYFATGRILDLSREIIKFEGYGISTRTLYINMTVSLRVVDVREGTVFFIGEKKVDNKVPLLGTNKDVGEDYQGICQDLLKKALSKLVKELEVKAEEMELALPEVNF